jgi:crotonobetainyl-CoA:carnitine CoA-transferase CaiB-like acyl-CoA transferase
VLQAGAANPPVDDGFPDPCSGLAVASAALLGLMERERTGHGLFLETNMLLSAGYAASEWLVDFQGAPPLPRVDHDQQGISALCRIYTCASGSIFLYVAREREWRRLVSAVGLNDKRFADPVSRKEHDDELLHTLAKTFMDKSAEEWEHDLVNCGVAVAAVERNGFGAFMRRHNLLTPAYHETYANYWRMPGRVTLSAAPPRLGPAPRVGEHTRAILRELGFEEGEVDDMVTTTQEGVRL